MKHFSKKSWDLVWLMAKTDFKLRYQGSILGFLWALLKPLFLFGILYLVFSNFFGQQTPYYSLQLLTGIFLWSFFAEGTSVGLMSLQNKAHLLTKIYFPRWIVVVASTFQSLLTLMINLLILLVVVLVSGVSISLWQIVLFGLYLLVLYGIVLGFSFFMAPFFLRFRDVNQIWEVLLMGGFYAAPIIYPLSALPSWLQPWMYLNPMTFLIEHVRGVLFLGTVSRLDHHVMYFGVVLLVFLFGIWFFRKYEKRVIELL
jgi:ABC-2 type transport system permease protein